MKEQKCDQLTTGYTIHNPRCDRAVHQVRQAIVRSVRGPQPAPRGPGHPLAGVGGRCDQEGDSSYLDGGVGSLSFHNTALDSQGLHLFPSTSSFRHVPQGSCNNMVAIDLITGMGGWGICVEYGVLIVSENHGSG